MTIYILLINKCSSTELAFSPNDYTVHIFKMVGKKWEPEDVLKEVHVRNLGKNEDIEQGLRDGRNSVGSK